MFNCCNKELYYKHTEKQWGYFEIILPNYQKFNKCYDNILFLKRKYTFKTETGSVSQMFDTSSLLSAQIIINLIKKTE